MARLWLLLIKLRLPKFRSAYFLAILVVLVLFYVGRSLYWKIFATVHDIRHNKQTVKQGLSQIVYEAQRSVGWFQDESDSGALDDWKVQGGAAATARRLL